MSSPRKPLSRSANESRPASQREAVRRTLGSWRFVTSAGDPAITELRSPRSLAHSWSSIGGGDKAQVPAPPMRPNQNFDARSINAAAAGTGALARPVVLDPVQLCQDSPTRSTAHAVESPAVEPLTGETLREYSPTEASGGAALDRAPDAIASPSEEQRRATANPPLPFHSVIKAAVESAERSSRLAHPRSSMELLCQMVGVPPPAESKAAHTACLERGSSREGGPLDLTAVANSGNSSRPGTSGSIGNVFALDSMRSSTAAAAGLMTPMDLVRFTARSPLSAPPPRHISRVVHAAPRVEPGQVQQSFCPRPAVQSPAQSPPTEAPGSQAGTTTAVPLLSLDDTARSTDTEAFQRLLTASHVAPDDDDLLLPASERRVTFNEKHGKKGGKPPVPAPSPKGASNDKSSSLTFTARRTSPQSSRRTTVASLPASSRHSLSPGPNAPHSPRPTSDKSDQSAPSSREWVAAGGVAKSDPLYKFLAATLSDVQAQFEFVDPAEIKALDNILFGLQHAHVHRIYGQRHSVEEAARGFADELDVPLPVRSAGVVLPATKLTRTRRAVEEAGGKRAALLKSTNPHRHGRRQATTTVKPQIADGDRAAAVGTLIRTLDHGEQPLRQHISPSSVARRAEAASASWAAEAQREAQRHDAEVEADRAKTRHFLKTATQLRLEADTLVSSSPSRPTTPVSGESDGTEAARIPRTAHRRGRKRGVHPPRGARVRVDAMTRSELAAFLTDLTVDDPDVEAHDRRMTVSAEITGATSTIEAAVAHLALVMPPEDRIEYHPASPRTLSLDVLNSRALRAPPMMY